MNFQQVKEEQIREGDFVSVDDSPLVQITGIRRTFSFRIIGDAQPFIDSKGMVVDEFACLPATKLQLAMRCPHFGEIAGKHCRECGEKI